jgi:predicted GH43/DUF377 family glycosyl hydrolase
MLVGGTTFGTDDPRIVWRGETYPLMTNTTLAAVGDPDTCFLFAARFFSR